MVAMEAILKTIVLCNLISVLGIHEGKVWEQFISC